ncbi:uncharacterized protein LOC116144853 [Pistacia vera]|uniref:uncharacterized protein LOC116144853 n=1 Tax=Pistacia vera TaxID=55513 RepID=UPI001263B4CD|nr:uncharacterized protein LOC116144853 [Pistacia vera]
MDNLSHHRKASLVLEGEDCFFNRVLSKDSSVGCSSRILYYRSPEGVPFKWEMQPGTPKDPPKEDVLPPLSPPPAVLSLGYPKPCINVDEPPRVSIRSRLMFWKHSKKSQGSNNNNKKKKVQAANNEIFSDNFVNCDQFYSSDGDEDFMASSSSPGDSRSSSSSCSSFSFSNIRSSHSSRLQSPARESVDRPHHHHHQLSGCSPLNLSSVLVRVTKR